MNSPQRKIPKKEIVILNNVALPLHIPEREDELDLYELKHTLEYYPSYLRFSHRVISPAQYFNEVLGRALKTGNERNRTSELFAHHFNLLPLFSELHKIYKEVLKTKII